MDHCSAAIQAETGWSLTNRLFSASVEKSLEEIDFIQPSLFAVTIALAALWKSWGIAPSAVVGHSMGEVAAAFIAGALSLEDATAVICRRSRLMMTIRGRGAMATVELAASDVAKRLAEYQGRIVVAASNSPSTTVIAGDPEQIDVLLASLDRDEIFCRRVKVDVASHCFHVDPILEELSAQLASVQTLPVSCPLYSTVKGELLTGREMNANYWVRNLREPVLFAKGIQYLAKDGCDIFIELSPHPILLPAIDETLRVLDAEAFSVPSLRRQKPERVTMLSSLGRLFTAGHSVDWKKLFPVTARAADFSTYPFRRERCWPAPETLDANRQAHKATDFAYLGRSFTSSLHPDTMEWEVDLDLSRFQYLNDHKVKGSVIVPATVQIEIALEAIQSLRTDGTFELHDMILETPLQPSQGASQEIRVCLTKRTETSFEFEIRGRAKGLKEDWTLYSKGLLQRSSGDGPDVKRRISIAEFIGSGTHRTSGEHYKALSRKGLEYGSTFRLVAECWTNDKENLVRIDTRQTQRQDRRYVVYPPVLDACLQSISQVGMKSSTATCLPVGVKRLRLHESLVGKDEIYCLAKELRSEEKSGIVDVSLSIYDGHGLLLAEFDELRVQKTGQESAENIADLLFSYDWRKSPLSIPDPPLLVDQHVLIFADRHGVADALRDVILRNGGRASLVYPSSEYFQKGKTFHINPLDRQDIERVFAATHSDPARSIVHLWSIDRTTRAELDGNAFLSSQDCMAFHLPLLVQAVTGANFANAPRLWAVTKGVCRHRRRFRYSGYFCLAPVGSGCCNFA